MNSKTAELPTFSSAEPRTVTQGEKLPWAPPEVTTISGAKSTGTGNPAYAAPEGFHTTNSESLAS